MMVLTYKREKLIENVLIGGNHLANWIGADHPPFTATTEVAMAHYYAKADECQDSWNLYYDIWCAWKTIMELSKEISYRQVMEFKRKAK